MLFTRCPNCETTFRITDQALRKAAGQVRCGRCACVFDAYAELREQRGEPTARAAEERAPPAGNGAAAQHEIHADAQHEAHAVAQHEADARVQRHVRTDDERDEDAPQHDAAAAVADDDSVAEDAFAPEDPAAKGAPAADDPADTEGDFAAEHPAVADDAAAESAELVSEDVADAPDSPLDPDAEWFATATLFIVEAAASERSEPASSSPAPSSPAPSSPARSSPAPTSPRPPPRAPVDEVLDDYSVAAVLEQIESSSLAAENEAADEGQGTQASGSADSARVLDFEASEARGSGAPNRGHPGAQDSSGAPASKPGAASAASRTSATSAAARTKAGKTAAAAAAAASKDPASARAAASPDGAASAAAALFGEGAKAADVARAAGNTPRAASPWHASGALEPPPFAKPSHRASGAWLYASLSALLLLGAQLTNHFRSDLARVDALAPVLRNFYARIGIDLIPRWDLAAYRIVDWVATAEPNAKGRGSLHITAQIRNEGRRPQPYPLVHLQLKDRWEKSVASRMFRPVEYLPPRERADRLMPAGATARAELEVVDPGPDAYGFELDVCILQPDKSVRCAADDVFR